MDEVFVSDVEFLIALAKVIDDAGLKSNIDACIRYIPHQPLSFKVYISHAFFR